MEIVALPKMRWRKTLAEAARPLPPGEALAPHPATEAFRVAREETLPVRTNPRSFARSMQPEELAAIEVLDCGDLLPPMRPADTTAHYLDRAFEPHLRTIKIHPKSRGSAGAGDSRALEHLATLVGLKSPPRAVFSSDPHPAAARNVAAVAAAAGVKTAVVRVDLNTVDQAALQTFATFFQSHLLVAETESRFEPLCYLVGVRGRKATPAQRDALLSGKLPLTEESEVAAVAAALRARRVAAANAEVARLATLAAALEARKATGLVNQYWRTLLRDEHGDAVADRTAAWTAAHLE